MKKYYYVIYEYDEINEESEKTRYEVDMVVCTKKKVRRIEHIQELNREAMKTLTFREGKKIYNIYI